MHRARKDALRGIYKDYETWDLYYPVDFIFNIWRLIESMEWHHLPNEGGLLEQEEALLEDLMTVSWVSQMVEAMVDANMANEG